MSESKQPAAPVFTIDGHDVSVWIKPDGYYVMLSFNRGEHTFVLGFPDAHRLGEQLIAASKRSET